MEELDSKHEEFVCEKMIEIEDKYSGDILKFNKIISGGVDLKDFKIDELIERFKLQTDITLEEVEETIKAKSDGDIVEWYDGIADVLFTAMFLSEIVCIIEDDFDLSYDDFSFADKLGYIKENLGNIFLDKDLDFDLVEKCLSLVIENNMLKFTTDEDEFNGWKYDTSKLTKKCLEVDGENYFFIVDENGKVRKRDNFPKVDLSFVLENK